MAIGKPVRQHNILIKVDKMDRMIEIVLIDNYNFGPMQIRVREIISDIGTKEINDEYATELADIMVCRFKKLVVKLFAENYGINIDEKSIE